MRDLVGGTRRGKNPLGHIGNSENYFVLLDSGVAYDHKRDVAYTPLSYLACAVGVRDLRSPNGRFSDEEILDTWVGVKEQLDVFTDEAQVPRKALLYAALEMGVATEDDFGDVTRPGPNGEYTRKELPAELYNQTIEQFEDHYGIKPGVDKMFNRGRFEVDGLTKENSVELFAERFITADASPDDEDDVDYIHVKSSKVQSAYEKFCELNDVEALYASQTMPKLTELLDCEKGVRRINGTQATRFVGVILTNGGETLVDLADE